MKMILSDKVEFLISRLNAGGHRADVVGGCVRDFLLGNVPGDYDMTTDATPEEMRTAFSDLRTVDTGIKHGTLTVILDSEPFEITTYRLDGEYSDNRHPDSVSFTRKLSEDLARRDFTVNAMCYNPYDGLTDLFGGIDDLKNKVLRAVGNPERRFCEDALRIMRALRFAATLNFTIEEKTSDAIFKTAHLLKNVSAERIYTEWKKLLSGVGAHRILTDYSSVISEVIPELSGMKLASESSFSSADAKIRELSLFAMANTEGCEKKFLSAMEGLRSDNKRKKFGEAVLSNYKEKTDTDTALNLLLIKVGEECTRGIVDLKILLGLSDISESESLSRLLSSGVCYRISDMKINGNDVANLGIRGKDIGEVLEKLLLEIAEGKVKNDRAALLSAVANFF